MAFTTANRWLLRPWERNGRRRYQVYSTRLKVGTTTQQVATGGGVSTAATTTADWVQPVWGPGRIVGIQYGSRTAAETYAALTGGALVVKAESTAGVQIFTDATLASVQDGFKPVGTTAVSASRGVTAATDGFSGGFPIRGGIFYSITGGTDGETLTVDALVRHCTYARIDLIGTSGADGSATATWDLNLGGPGTLAAVALTFANEPVTTDVTITADDATTGTALFTSTDSATNLAPSLIGRPGGDEANAATAATDGTEGANGFKNKLSVKIAQGDAFTSSNEKVTVELWIDD